MVTPGIILGSVSLCLLISVAVLLDSRVLFLVLLGGSLCWAALVQVGIASLLSTEYTLLFFHKSLADLSQDVNYWLYAPTGAAEAIQLLTVRMPRAQQGALLAKIPAPLQSTLLQPSLFEALPSSFQSLLVGRANERRNKSTLVAVQQPTLSGKLCTSLGELNSPVCAGRSDNGDFEVIFETSSSSSSSPPTHQDDSGVTPKCNNGLHLILRQLLDPTNVLRDQPKRLRVIANVSLFLFFLMDAVLAQRFIYSFRHTLTRLQAQGSPPHGLRQWLTVFRQSHPTSLMLESLLTLVTVTLVTRTGVAEVFRNSVSSSKDPPLRRGARLITTALSLLVWSWRLIKHYRRTAIT